MSLPRAADTDKFGSGLGRPKARFSIYYPANAQFGRLG
jgi:hypothetical protein